MRRSIEKLAWLLAQEDLRATIGELSQKYEEPPLRITDALDVLKIRRGEPTQIPAIDWESII